MYHWTLGPCELVLLMFDLALLNLDIAWLSHLVLAQIWSCCIIHSLIYVQWCIIQLLCCCRCTNSSLNGHCRVYAMHLGGAWYGLLSGMKCNENVPLKHPILFNTSLISHSCYFVISVLTLLSLSLLGPGRKYFVTIFIISYLWLIFIFKFWNIYLCLYSSPLLHQYLDLCLFCSSQGCLLPSSLLCFINN